MTTLFASFLAAILGFVEGATEFIPVSSSGHLILMREVLEHYFVTAAAFLEQNALGFDAVLQLAAIFAVLIYFRADVWRLARTVLMWFMRKSSATQTADRAEVVAVVIGTIPGVVAGLLLENVMETVLRAPLVVAVSLLAGSALMALAEKSLSRRSCGGGGGVEVSAAVLPGSESNNITIKNGLIVGLFQALALVPGFSRSGATISGGLLLGMNRERAARFSFILSLPIIAGSGAKKLIDLIQSGAVQSVAEIMPLIAGGLAAFLVGLAAIAFLMRYLRTHSMVPFVWYRVALAVVILLVALAA